MSAAIKTVKINSKHKGNDNFVFFYGTVLTHTNDSNVTEHIVPDNKFMNAKINMKTFSKMRRASSFAQN